MVSQAIIDKFAEKARAMVAELQVGENNIYDLVQQHKAELAELTDICHDLASLSSYVSFGADRSVICEYLQVMADYGCLREWCDELEASVAGYGEITSQAAAEANPYMSRALKLEDRNRAFKAGKRNSVEALFKAAGVSYQTYQASTEQAPETLSQAATLFGVPAAPSGDVRIGAAAAPVGMRREGGS